MAPAAVLMRSGGFRAAALPVRSAANSARPAAARHVLVSRGPLPFIRQLPRGGVQFEHLMHCIQRRWTSQDEQRQQLAAATIPSPLCLEERSSVHQTRCAISARVTWCRCLRPAGLTLLRSSTSGATAWAEEAVPEPFIVSPDGTAHRRVGEAGYDAAFSAQGGPFTEDGLPADDPAVYAAAAAAAGPVGACGVAPALRLFSTNPFG